MLVIHPNNCHKEAYTTHIKIRRATFYYEATGGTIVSAMEIRTFGRYGHRRGVRGRTPEKAGEFSSPAFSVV
jgi:hypothetical protein